MELSCLGFNIKTANCYLGFMLVVCFSNTSSDANENTIGYDTSVAGQIAPVEETVIQVRDEELDIHFEPISHKDEFIAAFTGFGAALPLRVEVTARYRLFNPLSEDLTPLIAFPIMRSGPEEKRDQIRLQWLLFKNQSLPTTTRRGVRCQVTINGQEFLFDYVSFESLFEKEREGWVNGIRKWLEQWPEIAKVAEPVHSNVSRKRQAFG